jgi:hypothetical protein
VTLGLSQHNSAQLISADHSWGVHGHTMACWGIEGSNFPFGLGFLLATFFFIFVTLFAQKKSPFNIAIWYHHGMVELVKHSWFHIIHLRAKHLDLQEQCFRQGSVKQNSQVH